MRAAVLILPLALAACDPAGPLPSGVPNGAPGVVVGPLGQPVAPVAVSHASFGPAPQPLPDDVVASLPVGVAAADVFVAPDGCYFFLQGGTLMVLTRGDTTIRFCP